MLQSSFTRSTRYCAEHFGSSIIIGRIQNPVEIDDFISAETPNTDDPSLKELLLKWIIHSLCGELNQKASCMIEKMENDNAASAYD